MALQPEDRLLLACTRQTFAPAAQAQAVALCQQNSINWQILLKCAVAHKVGALVVTHLLDTPALAALLPPQIAEKMEEGRTRAITSKKVLFHQIHRALRRCRELSVDVMLVKGVAHDLAVYEQPWYVAHDADLLFRQCEEELPAETLRALREFFVPLRGFEYDFFSHHDVTMNGSLPVDFNRIWANAVKAEHGGEPFWLMNRGDMLLTTCINSCRKRFFRLKSLLDIATIAESMTAAEWAEFAVSARQYRCQPLVYTALYVVHHLLDHPIPQQVWDSLAIHPLRKKAIHLAVRKLVPNAIAVLARENSSGKRALDGTLLLPYLTFNASLVRNRLRFALLYTDDGYRRTVRSMLSGAPQRHAR